jgi:hypothetical protein
MGIPTMAGKEGACMTRVKTTEMTIQNRGLS